MKHQVKPSVLFAIVKIVEMNYTGHVCRLIVDELPVDAYGMKVLAAARELWVKQGKVCIGTGRTIGSSFPVVQIIGGEPMNYPQRVIEIVRELRDANPNVLIKLFTGFPDTEALLKIAPLVNAISVTLASVDDENHFRAARLGFRDFGKTRMEVRYNSATGEDPTGRVFPQYWRLVDMAKEGDYLLESTAWVMKYANGTLFN